MTPQAYVRAHRDRVDTVRAQVRAARRQAKKALTTAPAPHPPVRPRTTGPVTTITPQHHRTDPRPENLLAAFLARIQLLQTAWETYAETHTDPSGWPYDDQAHQQAEQQRSAAAWAAYEPVSLLAVRLVASAENRLPQVPTDAVRSGWVSQLGILASAAHGLDAVRVSWEEELDRLPPNARPGTAVYDTVAAERDEAAWPLLEMWALHGQTVLDIRAAAGPSRTRLRTTAAPPVTSTSSTPAARR
ncbi:hypothetical protein [Streptomyces jumonjinensis]|uniref:hypothetical protein n=1 Tax=Streptomyces jumonjinensis TaxID=1945 RepID=UPI0037BD077B